MLNKCKKFLEVNGWKSEPNEDEYVSYYKDNNYSIDINENEIVILADVGDIIHLPCNYYALLGVLIDLSTIAIDYKRSHL